MCITPNSEEAKCFESLVLLTGNEKKAWQLMSTLGVDGTVSLPFYGNAIYAAIGKDNNEISKVYKDVAEAFDSERIDYSIIPSTSPLFPHNKSNEPVYYLYTAGNKQLLATRMVTCIGSPMPSLQGKSDMAEAVSAIIALDGTVIAPLDSGLGAFALSVALKEGGNAIGVLSNSISKCPSQNLVELMHALYEKGLLITQFAPSVKSQKWHIVLRNRFLAGISESVYLAEDKNGGPSWSIFDSAKELGARTMIAHSLVENPNCRWAYDRVKEGALVERTPVDIKKLLPPRRGNAKRVEFDDLTPDLFS